MSGPSDASTKMTCQIGVGGENDKALSTTFTKEIGCVRYSCVEVASVTGGCPEEHGLGVGELEADAEGVAR